MFILLLLLVLNIHASEESDDPFGNREYLRHMNDKKKFQVGALYLEKVLQGNLGTKDPLLLALKNYDDQNSQNLSACIGDLNRKESSQYSRTGTQRKKYLTFCENPDQTLVVINTTVVEGNRFYSFKEIRGKTPFSAFIAKSEHIHHYCFMPFKSSKSSKSSKCAIL